MHPAEGREGGRKEKDGAKEQKENKQRELVDVC